MTTHTYLVTGAAGFIGSHVTARLLRDGHQVIALDRSLAWAAPPEDPGGGALTAVQGDVTDFALLAGLLAEHRADRIIHLAAELHDRSAAQRGQCIQSNVAGTYNVLEAARLAGVPRTVLASSAALFEEGVAEPMAEDAPVSHWGDVYEASKLFGETMAAWYSRALGVVSTSIRIGLAYGAACQIGVARRLIDEAVVRPLAGQPGRLEFEAGAMMNMVYIHDTVDAFVLASQGLEPASPVYHVRGDYRSMADLIAIARQLIPGAQLAAGDKPHRWPMDFDDAAIRRDYGYATRWSLEAGMAEVVKEKSA